MENTYLFAIIALIIVVIFVVSKLSKSSSQTRKVFKNNTYSYIAKDLLMTRTETCDYLNINSTTLWNWTKSRKVTAYGLGNRIYYKNRNL